jgi:hypothetical protein
MNLPIIEGERGYEEANIVRILLSNLAYLLIIGDWLSVVSHNFE